MALVKFFKNLFKRLIKRKRKSPRKRPVRRSIKKRKVRPRVRSKKLPVAKRSKPAKKQVKFKRKARSVTKKKRPAVPKAKKSAKPAPVEKEIGRVTHYFDRINVAVIEFNKTIQVGDRIRFACADGDFVQMVMSMQIDRKDIVRAPKGKEVGLKVGRPVKPGDKAYFVG